MNKEEKSKQCKECQLNNFIGYGDMSKESPLTVKSKRWCPLKGISNDK